MWVLITTYLGRAICRNGESKHCLQKNGESKHCLQKNGESKHCLQKNGESKHCLQKNVFERVFDKLSNDMQVDRICTCGSLVTDV